LLAGGRLAHLPCWRKDASPFFLLLHQPGLGGLRLVGQEVYVNVLLLVEIDLLVLRERSLADPSGLGPRLDLHHHHFLVDLVGVRLPSGDPLLVREGSLLPTLGLVRQHRLQLP